MREAYAFGVGPALRPEGSRDHSHGGIITVIPKPLRERCHIAERWPFRLGPRFYDRPASRLEEMSLVFYRIVVLGSGLLHSRHLRNLGHRNVPPRFIARHSLLRVGLN